MLPTDSARVNGVRWPITCELPILPHAQIGLTHAAFLSKARKDEGYQPISWVLALAASYHGLVHVDGVRDDLWPLRFHDSIVFVCGTNFSEKTTSVLSRHSIAFPRDRRCGARHVRRYLQARALIFRIARQ